MAILNKILKVFFNKKTQNDITRIKIFGLTLYKKIKKDCEIKEYIFGLKIFQKLDLKSFIIFRENVLNKIVQKRIETIFLHQKTFLPYKGIYEGKSISLIACGPTLNHFKHCNDSIFVGLNRSFIRSDIKFKYLFTIDNIGIKDYFADFVNYLPEECIKFIGNQDLGKDFEIPEQLALKVKNSYRYNTDIGLAPKKFVVNIDSAPLVNSASVSIQAMQFILFTNPQKVYLVGIDCSVATKGHFDDPSKIDTSFRGENTQRNDLTSIKDWQTLGEFAKLHYPETEIISVNPVGLKGIFKDVYTLSFLNSNPDLKAELGDNIEILEDNAVKSR
jgi:hypothetical protein